MCDDFPCISACGPGVLSPRIPPVMGTAQITAHLCIAHHGTTCTVCSERCPVDLAIQVNGGSLALLENRASTGEWLGVRLLGAGRNRGAVGARMVVRTGAGAQARWILAGDSYQSSGDRRALFGLGTEAPSELEIRWPSGRRQRLVTPPTGRYLQLPEPAR